MNCRVALCCFALTLLACGPMPETLDSDSSELLNLSQEIIGGTIATGDPAVVAVAANGTAFCSATLIGQLTVLTAAHCLADLPANAQLSVVFGTNSAQPTKSVRVTQALRDARYNGIEGGGYDVGVLRLATAVTDVTPIPMNPTPLTQADIGKRLRHIGYGVTDGRTQTGFGTKRLVTLPIRAVSALELESGAAGQQTCNGDSGGPALMVTAGSTVERVIGITSYGDANCVQTGYDTRVDTVFDFVSRTAATWEKLGTCQTDAVCMPGCVPVDVDCACAADGMCSAACTNKQLDPDCIKDCGANGVCAEFACATPDPDCVAAGGACQNAAQCLDKQCVSDPQHTALYCSQTCTASSSCGTGMECSEGVCKYVQKPEVALGQSCTADSFCQGGGICVAAVGGQLHCAKPCGTGDTCGSQAEECVAAADSQRFCRTRAAAKNGTSFEASSSNTEAGSTGLPDAVGCSSTGGSAFAPGALLLGFAALLARRRQRSV